MLFCGTLAFAISLVDVFLNGLETTQINRLIWAPEMVGCVLFLVSGHIGIIEVCHGRFQLLPPIARLVDRRRQPDRFLAVLRCPGWPPSCGRSTGEVISVAVINWGTALGAACFSVAGLAQLFERPDTAPAPDPDRRSPRRRAAGRRRT